MPAVTVHSNCDFMAIVLGCFLYDDAAHTIPAANGKYANAGSGECFTVSGGLGEITFIGSCGTTTTTTSTSTTSTSTTSTSTSTTSTSTTSTSTSSSTTTTTTTAAAPGIGNLNVNDASDAPRILSVGDDAGPTEFNEVSGTYPCIFGDGGVTVDPVVQGTITLYVSVDGTGGSIAVVDSNGTPQCQNWAGAGDYTFAGFVINTNTWSVSINSAAC